MSQASSQAPFIYVAGKVAGLLLAPLAVIILPGVLGEEGYGRYGYWFALISIYIVLIDMGSQALLRRYIPQLLQQHPSQIGTLFWITQRLKLLPLILLLAALLFSDEPKTTLLLIIAALCAAIANNLSDIYYAYQKMGLHAVAVLSRKILRLVLVPLFFVLWDIPGVLLALLLAEVFGLVIATPAIKQLSTSHEALSTPFSQYYRHSFLLFIAFFISTLCGRIPVFSAEWAGISLDQIGHIALCVDLTYFALKELTNSLTESIYPQLIKHKTANNMASFNSLIGLNYRLINFTALAIIAIGIPLAPGFLALLGDSFYLANQELQLLLIALLFSCWNNIHGHIQLIHNHSKQLLIAQFCGLASNLLLVIIMFDQLTIFHLAIALALGTTVSTLISYLDTAKLTQHTPSWPTFLRLLPATILTALFIQWWAPKGMVMVLLAGIVAVISYTLFAVLGKGLLINDIQTLRNALQSRNR